jgi:hypothetical protein
MRRSWISCAPEKQNRLRQETQTYSSVRITLSPSGKYPSDTRTAGSSSTINSFTFASGISHLTRNLFQGYWCEYSIQQNAKLINSDLSEQSGRRSIFFALRFLRLLLRERVVQNDIEQRLVN